MSPEPSKTPPMKKALWHLQQTAENPGAATAPVPAIAPHCHTVPLLNAGISQNGFFQEGNSPLIPLLKSHVLWPVLLTGFLDDRPQHPVLWVICTVLPTSGMLFRKLQESAPFPILGTYSRRWSHSFQPQKHHSVWTVSPSTPYLPLVNSLPLRCS